MRQRPRPFLRDVADPELRESLAAAVAKADGVRLDGEVDGDGAAPPAEGVIVSVKGEPKTAGSKQAFALRRGDGSLVLKRGFSARYHRQIDIPCFTMVDDARGEDWRKACAAAGAMVMRGLAPYTCPLAVAFAFRLERPAGHHVAGNRNRDVKPSAPARPATRPDLTKLVRAVEDALTGVVWGDDGQVVEQANTKLYATQDEAQGVTVTVRPLAAPNLFGEPAT